MINDVDINKVKNWLLKKIAGTISEKEEKLLHEWINQSPQNMALADRVFSKDFLISAVTEDNKKYSDNSWQKLYHKIGYYKFYPLLSWIAVAVMIGIIIGGYFILQNKETIIVSGSSKATLHDITSATIYPLTEVEGKALNYSRYIAQLPVEKEVELSPDLHRSITVPYGGEFQVLLEDSSLIHLGPGASLTIPVNFSKTNRTVKLSGEAYFIIYKDSIHPFIIQTEKVNVQVVGTKLNIEAYEDEKYTKIALEEGKIELKSATVACSLPVGHAAVIGEDKHINISKVNIYEYTAWHHNRLVFDNQPMETIMRKLSRWYDIKVAFGNDRIRDLHITMDVNKYDTFNKLADAMEKMDELQIQIKKNKVILISERNLNQE